MKTLQRTLSIIKPDAVEKNAEGDIISTLLNNNFRILGIKMLHLTVAGVWCVPCNEETDALVAAKAQLASERVTVIQALGDGPTEGVPATMTDLDNWIAKHGSNFTEMLDPNLANLGAFFSAASVPWNCDIDPRTMEIISDGTGWPGNLNSDLHGSPEYRAHLIPVLAGRAVAAAH